MVKRQDRSQQSPVGPLAPGARHGIPDTLRHLAVPMDSLRTFPDNPNRGDVEGIRASLKAHGQYRAISYNTRPGTLSQGCILAGNHTYLAAQAERWTHIAATSVDVDDAEALRIVLTDNEVARRAVMDDALTHLHLTSLGSLDGTGFTPGGLVEIEQRLHIIRPYGRQDDERDGQEDGQTAGAEGRDGGKLPGLADMPAPADPTLGPSITQEGQLIVLDGVHRILVADARDEESWGEALADRAGLGGAPSLPGTPRPAQLIVTSPPYADKRTYDQSRFAAPAPDDYVAWYEPVGRAAQKYLAGQGAYALNIKAGCVEGERSLYVLDLIIAHRRQWGFRLVEEYCWPHQAIPGSVKRRFKNAFEPIYLMSVSPHYKFRPMRVLHQSTYSAQQSEAIRDEREARGLRRVSGTSSEMQGHPGAGTEITGTATAQMGGLAYPSNVLSGLGANREAWGHGAMFPPSLPTFFITVYSDEGDVVFDPFLGAGTTLLAAAAAGRVGVGIELSPHYADLAIERYRRAHPTCTLEIGGQAVSAEEWRIAFEKLGRTDAGRPQATPALPSSQMMDRDDDEDDGEEEAEAPSDLWDGTHAALVGGGTGHGAPGGLAFPPPPTTAAETERAPRRRARA